MKIYKYFDWNIPRCVNLWRGYYKKGTEEIGFGDDTTSPDNNAVELSENDFYAHVGSIGKDITEASELLSKLTTLSSKEFYGQKLTNVDEVKKSANEKVLQVFSDPSGKLTHTEYQIKLVSQMIVILLAYQGVINYSDTGITGVIDKSSADTYVQGLLPLWAQANKISSDAEQFIKDNF